MSEESVAQDERFSEIPERMQQQLRELPFTGEGSDDPDFANYHEVCFEMGNITCQAAVLYCKWVALPASEVAKFTGIKFVFDKDQNRLVPTPFPGLLDKLREAGPPDAP